MEEEKMRRRYHSTVLSALRKWNKGQKEGLAFLGQISRANMQRDHVRRATPSSLAADLAAAKIERDLCKSHQDLRRALDRMRTALDTLLATKTVTTTSATYEEKEIDFLVGLVAQGERRDIFHCVIDRLARSRR